MIRSTEAIIASVVMLGAIMYLFKLPSTEYSDPTEQYIRSVLDSYSDVIKSLITKDPYTLNLLLDASLPRGYNQRILINYFKKIITYTGVGSVPVEHYILLPSQGRASIPYSEMKSNWYKSTFRMKNSGTQQISGEKSFSVSLFKPDLIGGGMHFPIDKDSIQVFTDDGQLNASITYYEDYYDRLIVGLDVDVDLDASETKNFYVFYLVGDDYE